MPSANTSVDVSGVMILMMMQMLPAPSAAAPIPSDDSDGAGLTDHLFLTPSSLSFCLFSISLLCSAEE